MRRTTRGCAPKFAIQAHVVALWGRGFDCRAVAPQKRRGRANACAIRRGGASTCRSDRRLSPEVLKSIRRKFGVAHCMLDVAMAEPGLQRPRVVAGVSQGIATCVPEHVRMDREGHAGALAQACEQRTEALGAHRTAALGGEAVRARALLAP